MNTAAQAAVDVFIRLVGYELKLERCHVSQFDGNREFGPKAGGEPLLVWRG